MKSLSGFDSSFILLSIISNNITRMSSISFSKLRSSLLKFIFVTFSLKNSYIIIFSPVRDLLNMSVVNSASASDSFLPFTYLPIAYYEKNILTRISPIIS